MKLAAKLILIAFLAHSTLSCAGGILTIYRQLDIFQNGREDQVRASSQQLAVHLAQAWENGGRTGVENAIDNMPLEVHYSRMRWVQFNVDQNHPDSPSVALDTLASVVAGEVDSRTLCIGPVTCAGADDASGIA